MVNIWKVADKGHIYLIYLEFKGENKKRWKKIGNKYEVKNGNKEIQITQKKNKKNHQSTGANVEPNWY